MPVKVPVILLLLGSTVSAPVSAQEAAKSARPQASHVDRFASPRDRALREESEATAILKKTPADPEALSTRGVARVRLGKLDGALADLRRAADLAPRQIDLHTAVGYVLLRLNRPSEAKVELQKALDLDPEDFLANYHMGRMMLLSEGDFAKAAVHLERAVAARPDLTDIRFDLITAYRFMGDPTRASAQLRYLREVRPRDPRISYADGLLAADRGDLDAAISKFQATIAAEPRLKGVREDLALAFVRAGRWADAEPLLGLLAIENPRAAELTYLRGLALVNLGRTFEAETLVKDLCANNPKVGRYLTLYGVVRSSNGAPPNELVDIFAGAVKLDPGNFDAHYYLGRALYTLRDRVGAIAALSDAVRLDPDHVQARFFLATALEEEGQTDDAFAQYDELAKRSPDSPEGFVGKGAVLVKQGQFDEAIVALERAVSLDAGLFEAHYALGRALARAGQFDGAVSSLTRAVEIEPNRADAHYQLGLALRRAGRADEAAKEFQLVEKINEDFRTSTDGMGNPTPKP